MCGPCDGVFKKLKNRQVSCGINGCKHKWTWTAEEQIQAYATGKPNEPPRAGTKYSVHSKMCLSTSVGQ